MSWATPKIDWAPGYGIGTTDLNRMEENTRILSLGKTGGGNLASAESLDIGNTYAFFLLTGTTDIKYISTSGKEIGAHVYLQMPAGTTITFHHKEGSVPANYAAIVTGTGTDVDHYAEELVELIYNGTYWVELGRYTV
jgi:hypothetical protein